MTSIPDLGSPAINPMMSRHSKTGSYSYYDGSEAEILEMVTACVARGRPGHRDGVWLVPVPTRGFFTGTVWATDRTALLAEWVRRRPGEDAYIRVSALDAPRLPAASVEIVLYSREALEQEAGGEAAWEVVAIQATNRLGGDPPQPLEMARNMLRKPGCNPNTQTEPAFEDLADAVLYWGRRIAAGGANHPLSGAEYPPLIAGFVTPDRGEPYVAVWSEDMSMLPPPAVPEPRQPMMIARWKQRLVAPLPGLTNDARKLAEAIYYWSSRPYPQKRTGDENA